MHNRDFDDPIYKDWRGKVFKRDGYSCQMPGCRVSKTRINAHHIKKWANSPSMRFELLNGITLCWKCHKKVTGAEEQYEGLFLQIVYQNELR